MYRTLYSATWAQALNWLGWKDYSALRASPLRGRPSGVILPLLTHPLGPFLVDEPLQPQKLAGVEGFEPPYGGIKTRCLTAWRHPNGIKNQQTRSSRFSACRQSLKQGRVVQSAPQKS